MKNYSVQVKNVGSDRIQVPALALTHTKVWARINKFLIVKGAMVIVPLSRSSYENERKCFWYILSKIYLFSLCWGKPLGFHSATEFHLPVVKFIFITHLSMTTENAWALKKLHIFHVYKWFIARNEVQSFSLNIDWATYYSWSLW